MATLQRKTARVTAALYLGLAIAGAVGFLFLRPKLFVDGDAAATVANLAAHAGSARLLVVFELLVVLTQALAAAGFFLLFREVDSGAAVGIAAFGLVNAVVVLMSAALLGTAVNASALPAGDVQLLFLISGSLWKVGGLFFGLWLMPMGLCVLRSESMPRALGWVLIIGGVGYIVSTFFAGPLADVLVIPATIGELWMIGYLAARTRS